MSVLVSCTGFEEELILGVLPNELTNEIIALCDTRSKAALCRVSKFFYQLAHHSLYQLVAIRDKQIQSFDKALATNPEYATWVRNLRICWSREPDDMRAIDRILQASKELRELSLEWLDQLPDLNRLSFPHLHTLNIASQAYASGTQGQAVLAAFLNRHRTLLHLSLRLYLQQQIMKASAIDLPNLLTYRGSYNSPPSILINPAKLSSR
ncbi:hypothetical protein C8J56DRAFT_204243 [Mycena floridula]|nr:hypothetical protein C8J56DRAFT_204243 [Mycena floridula]